MSELFRAEIDSLMRMVERTEAERHLDHNERERVRIENSGRKAADRQAVLDTLAMAEVAMTSTEIATRAGVGRQRVDRMLEKMLADKIVTRRRRATRRADGQGFRNPYKYRISQ